MEKQALEYLVAQTSSREATQAMLEETVHTVVALHNDIRPFDLEPYLPERRRYRGNMTTESVEDFLQYTQETGEHLVAHISGEPDNDKKVVSCFINAEKMSAKAFFNLGNFDNPGHGDFTSEITLPKTADYQQLLQIVDRAMSQRALAEWMEDWSQLLVALDEKKDPLLLAGAVSNVRSVTINASASTTSEERTFGAGRSAMAEVEAKNKAQLPGFLEFTCEPYNGLPERTFILRVSMTTEDSPKFTLRIVRLEHHQEEMAKEFQQLLVDGFDGAPVKTYVGRFQP